jgi:hypothetical protein
LPQLPRTHIDLHDHENTHDNLSKIDGYVKNLSDRFLEMCLKPGM